MHLAAGPNAKPEERRSLREPARRPVARSLRASRRPLRRLGSYKEAITSPASYRCRGARLKDAEGAPPFGLLARFCSGAGTGASDALEQDARTPGRAQRRLARPIAGLPRLGGKDRAPRCESRCRGDERSYPLPSPPRTSRKVSASRSLSRFGMKWARPGSSPGSSLARALAAEVV